MTATILKGGEIKCQNIVWKSSFPASRVPLSANATGYYKLWIRHDKVYHMELINKYSNSLLLKNILY